jgi:hypothetical protein
MEEIKVSRIKKAMGGEIDAETLKALFSHLELPEWMVLKGKRGPFEWATSQSGRWGELYEAAGEREALRGLGFVDELSEVKKQVDDLSSQVESVVSELQQCKEGISTLLNELREKPIIKQTELFEIDESLEVIRPIPVVIEEYGDEVIASFPEIEAFGAGLCEAEAIVDLKNEVREIFFELEEMSDKSLGKLPLSWKKILSKVVRKIGNSQ